jgi:HD superfamily phosphohydrolase
MSKVTFADVVYESLELETGNPCEKIILELLDTPWVQRLRDISQTGNTRLVYMFSEHSRFGHSLGVAYLAARLLQNLKRDFPNEVKEYETAITAAALLHDIAHLAPGSHTAVKVWFPGQRDLHESAAVGIIKNDSQILEILKRYGGEKLLQTVCAILTEDPSLPPWTWQILSGGGWNVDRGNWCIADSILAGVSYGKYNISALINSIAITPAGELALQENRLDSMLHFAISRHAMYKQLYQHRVLLAADRLLTMLVKRCRDLGADKIYADNTMQSVLAAKSVAEISRDVIFQMRECWWRYHLLRWMQSEDPVLADISARIVNRRLLKTVAVSEQDDIAKLRVTAQQAVEKCGYNPDYYLYEISSADMFVQDSAQSLKVICDDGSVRNLMETDSIFQSIIKNASEYSRSWLVMPAQAKTALGRKR